MTDPDGEAVRLAEVFKHRSRHDRDEPLVCIVNRASEQLLQLAVEYGLRSGVGYRLDVLDELKGLVRLLFPADARAFADVRGKRMRLDAEPHPQAHRAFHVDRTAVPGRECDL